MTSPRPHEDQPIPAWLAAALSQVRRLVARLAGHAVTSSANRDQPPFADRYQPGLFIIESAQATRALTQQARDDGLAVARINGQGVTTKAAFLAAAARDLDFPDYFGHNWDAFADCLGDFAARPGKGTVLILDHFDEFARATPRDWQTVLTFLKRAAAERNQTTRPLYVFLQGPTDTAPGIPAITTSGTRQRANSGDAASTM